MDSDLIYVFPYQYDEQGNPLHFPAHEAYQYINGFYLPRLGNLLINKGNPYRDNLCFSKDIFLAHKENLQPSQVIYTTRKDNPYRENLRASRDFFTARKGSLTTLKVNLCSLTLWSNQGKLKDPKANQGINLDRCTVLGGKYILLNLWCNLKNLSF